jgi:hypothetical protein
MNQRLSFASSRFISLHELNKVHPRGQEQRTHESLNHAHGHVAPTTGELDRQIGRPLLFLVHSELSQHPELDSATYDIEQRTKIEYDRQASTTIAQ